MSLPGVQMERLLPSPESTAGYLLRLSRPRFWLYLAGPVVVAVAFAVDTVDGLFSPVTIGLFAFFLLPANVYLYGVNDIFDREIDRENPKKDNREVRFDGETRTLAAVGGAGGVAIGLVGYLVVAGRYNAAAVMLGFLFLATEYSAPPLRFKTVPFFDSISNGLYILPGVLAWTVLTGRLPPIGAIAGGWLWTMGMHTFSAIPDIEPDRQAGIRTTATQLGQFNTYLYCAVAWLLAAAAFVSVHPFFTVVLLVYPLLVFGIVYADLDPSEAYWWYPLINTATGMVLTLAGLWVLLYG